MPPPRDALARRGQDCGLVMLRPQEGFFVALQISFMGGFALAFPVIGFQLWRFVAPGLYRSEKNALLPFLLEGVALQPGMMQADGLHPTAQAQPKVLDNVWPLLRPLL